MDSELRYQRERDFHDRSFGDDSAARKAAVSAFYWASTSFPFYRGLIGKSCAGRRVLEYGCGPGSSAFELARRGAIVTAIDLSGVAIERALDRARVEGLDGIDFRQMNAEALEFADETFDLICGSAILHHLELRRAYGELARTLKPDGRAIFVEPLGHNPLIRLYRRGTPHLRTVDEHPLFMRDLRLAREYFGVVEQRSFQLQTFLAIPFRRTPLGRPLLGMLDALDRAMFRLVPPMQRYAWQVVVQFSAPKQVGPVVKAGGSGLAVG